LAAQEGDVVSLLTPEGEVGTVLEDTTKGADEISFNNFQNYEFKIAEWKDGKIEADKSLDSVSSKEFEGLAAVLVKDEKAYVLTDEKGAVGLDKEVSPGSEVM
ncbi:MAG: hypothetical protein ACOCZJ_01880, partial [Thermoplasmatota archaeon]